MRIATIAGCFLMLGFAASALGQTVNIYAPGKSRKEKESDSMNRLFQNGMELERQNMEREELNRREQADAIHYEHLKKMEKIAEQKARSDKAMKDAALAKEAYLQKKEASSNEANAAFWDGYNKLPEPGNPDYNNKAAEFFATVGKKGVITDPLATHLVTSWNERNVKMTPPAMNIEGHVAEQKALLPIKVQAASEEVAASVKARNEGSDATIEGLRKKLAAQQEAIEELQQKLKQSSNEATQPASTPKPPISGSVGAPSTKTTGT